MKFEREEILEDYLADIERKDIDRKNDKDFLSFYGSSEGLSVIDVPHQRGPNARKARHKLGFGG